MGPKARLSIIAASAFPMPMPLLVLLGLSTSLGVGPSHPRAERQTGRPRARGLVANVTYTIRPREVEKKDVRSVGIGHGRLRPAHVLPVERHTQWVSGSVPFNWE